MALVCSILCRNEFIDRTLKPQIQSPFVADSCWLCPLPPQCKTAVLGGILTEFWGFVTDYILCSPLFTFFECFLWLLITFFNNRTYSSVHLIWKLMNGCINVHPKWFHKPCLRTASLDFKRCTGISYHFHLKPVRTLIKTMLYLILATSSEDDYGRCWQTDQITYMQSSCVHNKTTLKPFYCV